MSQKVVDRIVELTRGGQIEWQGERQGSYNGKLISLDYTNRGSQWDPSPEWSVIVWDEEVRIAEVQFNEIKNAIKQAKIASESVRVEKIMGYLS